MLLALAAALLVPAAVAYYRGEPLQPFLVSAGVAGLLGLLLERTFQQAADFRFGRSEAFVLVSAAWITASLFGALPYVLIKGPTFIIDGFFESASGFTTTGASILENVEGEPAALLLWRSLTHWLGGMGIIVLGIAILPKLQVGGMELLGAEAPGPITEKLTPRIAQTAKALWGIYALFTALETGALIALGLSPLEAVNQAFATMATGGFSTRNASIAGFDSAAVEMVVVLFMMVAGANFALHFQMLRGRPGRLFRDSEFRFYIGVLGGATAAVALDLLLRGHQDNVLEALRYGVFQVTAIVTTTGFATADFDAWPNFSKVLLLLLMFVGGCAGSTGGSVKVSRIMIVAKKLISDLQRLVQPHAVLPVRIGRRAIPEEIVTSVTTFFLLFLTSFACGGLLLSMMGLDMVTAFSASAASLGNIGPGFAAVGPTQTYAPLPAPARGCRRWRRS